MAFSLPGRIGLPDHHVPRPRLTAALLGSPVGVVEAGAGYGKSVLAAELRAIAGVASAVIPLGPHDNDDAVFESSLRRAFRAARLSDLAAAMESTTHGPRVDRLLEALVETPEPVLVVLDDAHQVREPGVAAQILRLARGLPEWHRLLLTARRLPGPLEPLRTLPGAACLDTVALSLTEGETGELWTRRLGETALEQEVRELMHVTKGWTTAVVLAMSAIVNARIRSGVSPSLRAGADAIAAPLRAVLDSMSPEERAGIVQLGHLPLLSAEVAAAVTGLPALFDRMIDAGIPLLRTEGGWWELPGPVSTWLSGRAPLSPQSAAAAAEVYARSGETLTAVRLLIRAGAPGPAAAVLAGLSPESAEELGYAAIRNLAEALPASALAEHPHVLIHLARTAETAHQGEIRRTALARALAIVEERADLIDTPLWRELQAERARELLWDERTRSEARELAAAVVQRAGTDELVARARALDVLGRLASSWFSAVGPQGGAEKLLNESARLSRRLGQPTWAAQALLPLAMAVHFTNCRFDRALHIIDDILADLPARSRYRALVLSFRADLLTEIGRYAEAEASIEECRAIGRTLQEQWAQAMASWSEAALASVTGDRARTVGAVLATESHRDNWFEQFEGVEFLAYAADALDRVGAHDMARERLAAALKRMAGYERPVRLFEAAILGRSGDPERAEEAIVAALARPDLDAQERWPLLLLRAYAAHRRGDPAVSGLAAEAFEYCRAHGHPDGPLLREREAAQVLLPIAAAAGSGAAAELLTKAGRLSVNVLGGFHVRRGGASVDLPAGRPATAVRMVAAAGGRLPADQLIEALWPEVAEDIGHNRLRNLLSRLRLVAGNLLVRNGQVIAVEPGSSVDAVEFEAEAVQALQARDAGRHERAAGLARAALARYRGELLPDDRYETWAIRPRERLRGYLLELLDLLAADAESRGEFDEAVRRLHHAIDTEPNDESRYVRLAQLLSAQGRVGSARAVVTRAMAVLDDLGVTSSPSLGALQRQLGEDPTV